MKLVNATVKFQARNVNTKFGTKCNAVFTLADGEEATIWAPANHPPLFVLTTGQSVQLGLNSNGKYSLVEQPVSPVKSPVHQSVSTHGLNAVNDYLSNQAALYRDCYLAAVNAMSGLMESEESLRSVATALFIQAQKELPNLKARVEEFTPVKPVTLTPVINGYARH